MRRLLAQATTPLYVHGFAAPGIEQSKFTFDSLIRYYLASMVVLADQDIVPRTRARRLIAALLELQSRGADGIEVDPGLEDLHPNIEKAVRDLIGEEDAGDFGIARARAEFGHVAWHLALREDALETLGEQIELNRTLLGIAGRHLHTVIPYYTQHMRAEPITFGYYLSAFVEAFVENAERTRYACQRFAISPAGIGHIVPTMPINRKRLAELIGLGDTVHHSLHGYLNADLFVDVLGSASLTAATISRLCMDFWWWASNELHIVRFGDAWCGGSFIMPHKRNPSWLKALRFSSMAVKARHNEAQELWMHGTPMLLVGSLGIPGLAHEGLKSLRYACELLAGAAREMTIDAKHGHDVASQDFSQSSQLVSLIVSGKQASWRQAEHVVGAFVKEAVDAGRTADSLKFERLLEIGKTMLGREMEIKKSDFDKALDIDAIIAGRTDCGPAASAVETAIASLSRKNDALGQWVKAEQQRIAACWKNVEDLARKI